MVDVEPEMPSRVSVELLRAVNWRQKFGACIRRVRRDFDRKTVAI
jgi:hypothetical protein